MVGTDIYSSLRNVKYSRYVGENRACGGSGAPMGGLKVAAITRGKLLANIEDPSLLSSDVSY